MGKKTVTIIVMIVLVVLGAAGGVLAQNVVPSERHIFVQARQFGYDPAVIKVNKGDKVTIELISEDVTHGLYLDGYDVNLITRPAGDPGVATFIADKTGKFNFRCSQTCGAFHPFMIGKLVVEPNYLFPGSIGATIGLGAAALFFFARKEGEMSGE
ncbi:MAG: cupredoxin domain-containing protein [Thermincola sp.]|jgi:heme/copper-type cytochrome/quinol oxidase subunit 2|nr:cupredoxin domain-containing protein [Thermincola sp.]